MTKEDLSFLAQEIAKTQGEIAVAFIAIFKASILSQPNFDHGKFQSTIKELVDSPKASFFQKEVWKDFQIR